MMVYEYIPNITPSSHLFLRQYIYHYCHAATAAPSQLCCTKALDF